MIISRKTPSVKRRSEKARVQQAEPPILPSEDPPTFPCAYRWLGEKLTSGSQDASANRDSEDEWNRIAKEGVEQLVASSERQRQDLLSTMKPDIRQDLLEYFEVRLHVLLLTPAYP